MMLFCKNCKWVGYDKECEIGRNENGAIIPLCPNWKSENLIELIGGEKRILQPAYGEIEERR